jgi:Sulfotransferase family
MISRVFVVLWLLMWTVVAFVALRWVKSFDTWQKEEFRVIEVERQTSQSPVCGLNHRRDFGLKESLPITRIVFLHMRKAGGTTFWSYLRDVANKYNLKLEVYEGVQPPIPEEQNDNTTLFITSIREPVSRVLSHYKYEMRWNCNILTNKKAGFIPTKKNTRMSLHHFVEATNAPMKHGELKGHLWECSHNCYAKWSTGLCWDEGKHNETEYCWSLNHTAHSLLSDARRSLYAYNLVFVMEWLKNTEYVRSIETMFGLSGLAQRKSNMWCGAESAKANKKVPLVVTNTTLGRILHFNKIDTYLYDELTTCNKLHFPKRSIFSRIPNKTAQILIYQ